MRLYLSDLEKLGLILAQNCLRMNARAFIPIILQLDFFFTLWTELKPYQSTSGEQREGIQNIGANVIHPARRTSAREYKKNSEHINS